jgi:hypothetical protein
MITGSVQTARAVRYYRLGANTAPDRDGDQSALPGIVRGLPSGGGGRLLLRDDARCGFLLAPTLDGQEAKRAKDHEDHEQEPEDEHPVDLEVPEDLGEGHEQRRPQHNPGQIPHPSQAGAGEEPP